MPCTSQIPWVRAAATFLGTGSVGLEAVLGVYEYFLPGAIPSADILRILTVRDENWYTYPSIQF